MKAGTTELLRFGAGILLAAGAYPLQRLGWRVDPQRYWWAVPLVDVRLAGLVAGAVLGIAAPPAVGASLDQVAGMALVFAGGWLGLTAGCGLDLRVLRRHRAAPLLYEVAEAPALLVALAVLVFAATRTLDVVSGLVAAPAVFLVAGLCTAGDPLPAGRTSRKTSGPKHGFWQPSAAAMTGIVLVAVGTGFVPAADFAYRLPWPEAVQPIVIESVGLRIWWGLVLGGLAGLLCDLTTKENFALGGLYYLLAGVVLLCSGLAAALGLEPLLVGGVAGVWLINASLRRMDVVHVLDRGYAAPRLGVPVLAGWALVRAFPSVGVGGMDWLAFAVALVALVGLRPAVKLWGLNVGGHVQAGRRPRHRTEALAARLEMGELPLLVAVVLSQMEPAATGWAVLAAAALGQVVLGAVVARLRRLPAEGAG